jgi:hypothetical protein
MAFVTAQNEILRAARDVEVARSRVGFVAFTGGQALPDPHISEEETLMEYRMHQVVDRAFHVNNERK